MNSVKDLIKFLDGRSNGASMQELKEELVDEVAIKQFLKLAIDTGQVFVEGKKRGSRYYAKGKTPESEADYQTSEACLTSEKPIIGEAVFTKIGNIESPLRGVGFLRGGKSVEQTFVQYDPKIKKNIVTNEMKHTTFNSIALRREGRNYVMIVSDLTDKQNSSEETFKTYEDLRENLRVFLEL
jgi:hypothetical protein